MRPLLFPGDEQFWYVAQLALGHTAYGGADIGEVATAAARISVGDYCSWDEQWAATARRTEAEARGQLAVGHQVSARDGLLRAATYFRTAEFFTRDRDPDPRGRPAALAGLGILVAAAAATAGLQAVLGMPGTLLAIIAIVVFGDPTAGQSIATALLASPWNVIGRCLPPSAGLTAARSIICLGGVNLTGPLTVLAVYAAAGTLVVPVAAAWRQHRPAGPTAAGQPT